MTPLTFLNSRRTRIGGQLSKDEFVCVTNTYENDIPGNRIRNLANTYEMTYHTEVPSWEEIKSNHALVVDGGTIPKLVPNINQLDFYTELEMLEMLGVPIKPLTSLFQAADKE